jgi:hypothetical protein
LKFFSLHIKYQAIDQSIYSVHIYKSNLFCIYVLCFYFGTYAGSASISRHFVWGSFIHLWSSNVILLNRTAAPSVCFITLIFGRLIADWSVENVNLTWPNTGCRYKLKASRHIFKINTQKTFWLDWHYTHMTLHTNIPNKYKQIPIIQIKRDEIIKKKIIKKKRCLTCPMKRNTSWRSTAMASKACSHGLMAPGTFVLSVTLGRVRGVVFCTVGGWVGLGVLLGGILPPEGPPR